jgi:hypothetical protein
MEIKKMFLESSFLRVFSIVKKNTNIYLYTVVFDFIFLALIMFVGNYFGSFIPSDAQQIMELFKTTSSLLLFVFIYPLVYYLFVIFVYSLAKLSILNLIKSLYDGGKFNIKRFWRFYLLNIVFFVIFFFSALILFGVLSLIFERDFLKYLILILTIPFLFFCYSIINIGHTFFIKGVEKGLVKKSFMASFNKIKKYGMFLVCDIILVLVYLLLYNIIHLILRFTIFANKEILSAYGGTYMKIFNIISLIFVYLLIAFNRIYFYELRDKNVLQ